MRWCRACPGARRPEAAPGLLPLALARLEAETRYKDFNTFRPAQAVAFKRRLADQDSLTTGGKLGKATLHATLAHLKRFFEWLAGQSSSSTGVRATGSTSRRTV